LYFSRQGPARATQSLIERDRTCYKGLSGLPPDFEEGLSPPGEARPNDAYVSMA